MSHPFAEYWRWSTGYRLSQDIIRDLSDNAPPDLVEQKGTTITSSIGGALTRDSRDFIAAPSKGGQTAITLDFAGLGGDSQFYKVNFLQTYFWPVWFGHILGTRFETGVVEGWGGKEVPIYERYYLGGPNTIRAFKFRSVSPVDDAGSRRVARPRSWPTWSTSSRYPLDCGPRSFSTSVMSTGSAPRSIPRICGMGRVRVYDGSHRSGLSGSTMV
jgi:outer membrane protein insertion porin family